MHDIQAFFPKAQRTKPLALIIDDNQTQADLYRLVLEPALDIATAVRGEDGFAMTCQMDPDVVILDVMLPDVDGVTLRQRMLSDPRTTSVPVVMITGFEQAFDRARRDLPAGTELLMKPCKVDRLLETITASIQRPASAAS